MKIPRPVGEPRVLDGPRFGKSWRAQDFEYPSGTIQTFTHFHDLKWPSIVLPVTTDRRVVVVRQFRHAANKVFWEVPGGCPKPGQSAEECARQELLEECGFRAEALELLTPSVYFEPANNTVAYIPFLARGCHRVGKPRLDETECLEVYTFGVKQWLTMIRSGEVRDSKSIVVTMLALPHLGLLEI